MTNIERELDRTLLLLRNKIRERGFTQLDVQERLDWGRSYISQLLTKQKTLRFDQLLTILEVIGVERSEFFGELYPQAYLSPVGLASAEARSSQSELGAGPRPADASMAAAELLPSLRELQSLANGLADLLVDRGILRAEDLQQATDSARNGPAAPQSL